jgi:hypothetical protein
MPANRENRANNDKRKNDHAALLSESVTFWKLPASV